MIEEQGRAAQTDECGRVVPERDGALRLDDEDWRAVLAALPPRVSVRARNSARTRAFLDAVLWIAAFAMLELNLLGRIPGAPGPVPEKINN